MKIFSHKIPEFSLKILFLGVTGLVFLLAGTFFFTSEAQSPPPEPDITTGLVAHWKMDEAGGILALDSSGNEYHGTLNNSPVWVAGKVNNGLDFNGASSDVSGSFSLSSTRYTFAAWIKPSSLPQANFPTLFRIKRGGFTNGYIWIYFYSPTYEFNNHRRMALQFQDSLGYSTTVVAINTLVDLNDWTHIAITYDKDTQLVKFYKNGIFSESKSLASAPAMTFAEFHIGHIINNNNTAFDGVTDEARVYSRALTDLDVQGLYDFSGGEGGGGGIPADTTPAIRSNGAPIGTLLFGTKSATLTLKTNENATCRYDTRSGLTYSAMFSFFNVTGLLTHAATLNGLTNDTDYTYYVRCEDTGGNVNPDDYVISFSVAPPDTVSPLRAGGLPTGVLSSGTTSAALSLTTDESADCRYSKMPNTLYTDMDPVSFGSTGGLNHSTIVSELTNGNVYSYYVRCQDDFENANDDDYTISFAVSATGGEGEGEGESEGEGENVGEGEGEEIIGEGEGEGENMGESEGEEETGTEDEGEGEGENPDSPFPDVSSDDPYAEAIFYLHSEGIVEGFPDGYFRQDQKINRAEFLKILILLRFTEEEINQCLAANIRLDVSTVFFPDVPKTEWFAPYICIAKAAGIVHGYPDGTFHPEQNISLVEAAKIIVNTLNAILSEGDDVWYRPFVEHLTEANAIPITVFSFAQEINRGEMSETLYRLQENITNKESQKYEDLR